MRICIDGFGQFSDTLHIDTPKHTSWRAFTDVLSIGGVTYYYTQGCTVGVRYNGSVDPIDVAAQALIVTAASCNTPLDEVEVVVREKVKIDVDMDENKIATEVRERMLAMPAPAYVSLDQVVARGTLPAYYLM